MKLAIFSSLNQIVKGHSVIRESVFCGMFGTISEISVHEHHSIFSINLELITRSTNEYRYRTGMRSATILNLIPVIVQPWCKFLR